MTSSNGHHAGDIGDLSEVKVNVPKEVDTIPAMVQRMATQSAALLRQQLERKRKQEPMLYSQARVEQAIHQFEASSADIQVAIIQRVMDRVSGYLREEILRVLEDALAECTLQIEDPLWEDPTWNPRWRPATASSDGTEASQNTEPVPAPPDRAASLGGRSRPAAPAPEQPAATAPPAALPPAQPIPAPVAPIAQATVALAPPQAEPPVGPQADHGAGPPTVVDPVPTTSMGAPSTAAPLALDDLYEGTVKLQVEANGRARPIIEFINALRRTPEFRLLELSSSSRQSVGIWLALRVPLRLKTVLLQMNGVVHVEPLGRGDHAEPQPELKVRLIEAPSLN